MSEIKIGTVLDQRYQLVKLIGTGGMAVVYLANDLRTKHEVAVKILLPDYSKDAEFLERFDREAAAASKMSHHNIVNLLDVSVDKGLHYLVMEYVKGSTLKEIIQQNGPIPPDKAAQVAIRILSALEHAHKNGIIHRDIKPQNILIHAEGHVKVGDFGIAHVAGSRTLSKDDNVMGSVYYLSPEQARGREVTGASDIYSVGVVLYEMLTGHVPFDGDTPVAVAMMQIKSDPPPMSDYVSGIPPALERIVLKAMSKQPEKRYQSAFEMAQDLHRVIHVPDWNGSLTGDSGNQISEESSKQKKNPSGKNNLNSFLTKTMITIAGFMLAAGLVIWGIHFLGDIILNSTSAPYLLNETEEDAVLLLNKSGLKYEITRISHPDIEVGRVIMQTPEFDTKMHKGDIIALTISTGPFEQMVPDIIGKPLDEAKALMEKYGYTILVLPEKVLSKEALDTVIHQEPSSGTLLNQDSIIQIQLSGGYVELKSLVGLTLEEAYAELEKMNVSVKETVTVTVTEESMDNRIYSQKYLSSAGNELDLDTAVMQVSGVQVILAVQKYEPAE